jgi:hypothetical protein
MNTLVIALSAVLFFDAGAAAHEVPRIAFSSDDGPPLWVAASAALRSDGSLNRELFLEPFARRLESHRSMNADRCVSYLTAGSLHLPATATVEDRVAASYTVVSGEIVAYDDGFFFGVPGRLFALSVSARPKSFGHTPTARTLYLFAAQADIATSRGHFCSTPATGSVLPRVGDRVVAFAQLPSRDALGEILVVDLRSGLIVQRGKELFGPAVLNQGRAADLGEVLAAVSRSRGLHEVPRSPSAIEHQRLESRPSCATVKSFLSVSCSVFVARGMPEQSARSRTSG